MNLTGAYLSKTIKWKRLLQWKWFPPVAILLACLITAFLLTVFNGATSRPGMRRSFVVMIMPFAIAGAGIFSPLLYLLLKATAKGFQLLIKSLVILIAVLVLSYLTGWLYFNLVLNVPVPEGLWRFILQDIFAISMPFWIALAGMGSLRRLFKSPAGSRPIPTEQQATQSGRGIETLTVSHSNRTYIIDAESVVWAKAEGNYVRLFTGDRFYLKHISLKKLTEGYPDFIRIHRSHLINLHYLESMASLDHGDIEVSLKSGDRLKCSRGYATVLRNAIGAQDQ